MLYFVFSAGGEYFAIEASYIELVVPMVGVNSVAHLPNFVKGILEFEGEPVTVIDLCRIIGGEACPDRMHARIALVRSTPFEKRGPCLGILGEKATEILETSSPFIISQSEDHGPLSYIHPGVLQGSTVIQLIDVPRFFEAFSHQIYARSSAPR
ncbi:chemotaxis protein CheW [Estrella lausannensis]|uniref:Putative chemotaxis protein n=1 Tax=Estrella lausannensis TaxID=483423 RepID=A0A0H5DPC3_9BACT|nr:chemotaxis protein CheW [Estrella lausannensis]CRX38386.1 Putative chemotaxis protein [Estrella lausannensis]